MDTQLSLMYDQSGRARWDSPTSILKNNRLYIFNATLEDGVEYKAFCNATASGYSGTVSKLYLASSQFGELSQLALSAQLEDVGADYGFRFEDYQRLLIVAIVFLTIDVLFLVSIFYHKMQGQVYACNTPKGRLDGTLGRRQEVPFERTEP
mmetsp:Transcript_34226/g.33470  ORF Transcript_34226/g.33470 Transcript_34226/m.33470 type:complete len:151 (+) Transcript_34226:237-689(+)